MCIAAFVAAHEAESPTPLLLVILSDEENGGDVGARFLAEEQPDAFGGARHALGEFGGATQWIAGKPLLSDPGRGEADVLAARASCAAPAATARSACKGGAMRKLGDVLRTLDRQAAAGAHHPARPRMVRGDGGRAAAPAGRCSCAGCSTRGRPTSPRVRSGRADASSAASSATRSARRSCTAATRSTSSRARSSCSSTAGSCPGRRPDDLIRELHDLVGARHRVRSSIRHDPGPPDPDLCFYEPLAQIIRELRSRRACRCRCSRRASPTRASSAAPACRRTATCRCSCRTDFEPFPLIHNADERVPVDALAFGVEAITRGDRPLPGMKLLVLGGTKFLGRHAVDAALAGGHEVTIFTRGQTNPELFPEVEHLHGDRDGDLDALRGRTWDGVVDTSGYVPRVVRQSAELLRDAVGALRLRLEHLRLRRLQQADRRGDAGRGARGPGDRGDRWSTTARSRPRASASSRRSTATAAHGCAPG